MFDAAGVSYPTDDWTWEDLADASKKIHDKTGKYGFMAYNDDQLGYWCFVYQAGGHILTADRTQTNIMYFCILTMDQGLMALTCPL